MLYLHCRSSYLIKIPMKHSIILAIFLSFVVTQTVSAKTVSVDSFIKQRSRSEILNPLAKASYYFVDGNALKKNLSGGHIELTNFPCGNGEYVTFDLKPAHSAIDSHTECIVTTPQGDVHIAAPHLDNYRGKIIGEEHSSVFMTISDGSIICSIIRENGTTYVFAPEKNSSEMGDHMLIAESDLLATGPFKPFDCISDDIVQPNQPVPIDQILPHHTENEIQSVPLNNGKLLQTDIAVEADSQFYGAIGGDPSKTIAYIGAIFSMSSMIYEDEANLTHHLSWVKVWTTSDPYQVHGNAYALTDTAKKYWQLHYSNVQRDLAHIMTSIGYGGGGFGFYSLCDNANSYSVSSPQTGHTYPTFAFTYDVYIISHEIGHNFSLIHTHDCYWNPPLDTCYTKDDAALSLTDACYSKPVTPHRSPGTIMSYCQNTNYTLSGKDFSQYKVDMTFSPRPDSVMRYSAQKAACIQPPADPIVILLSPRGRESYLGGATIPLNWTYANLTNVTLEYSTNSGTTWSPIQSGVPASAATVNWLMPNVPSTKMLVRIYDAAHPATGDTSLLFFTIVKNSVKDELADNASVILIPNPAHDRFSLNAKQNYGLIECDLVDERGATRKHFKGILTSEQGLTFDIHDISSGKYFLHITDAKELEKILPVVVE